MWYVLYVTFCGTCGPFGFLDLMTKNTTIITTSIPRIIPHSMYPIVAGEVGVVGPGGGEPVG